MDFIWNYKANIITTLHCTSWKWKIWAHLKIIVQAAKSNTFTCWRTWLSDSTEHSKVLKRWAYAQIQYCNGRAYAWFHNGNRWGSCPGKSCVCISILRSSCSGRDMDEMNCASLEQHNEVRILYQGLLGYFTRSCFRFSRNEENCRRDKSKRMEPLYSAWLQAAARIRDKVWNLISCRRAFLEIGSSFIGSSWNSLRQFGSKIIQQSEEVVECWRHGDGISWYRSYFWRLWNRGRLHW